MVLRGAERSDALVFVVKEGTTWYDQRGDNFEASPLPPCPAGVAVCDAPVPAPQASLRRHASQVICKACIAGCSARRQACRYELTIHRSSDGLSTCRRNRLTTQHSEPSPTASAEARGERDAKRFR